MNPLDYFIMIWTWQTPGLPVSVSAAHHSEVVRLDAVAGLPVLMTPKQARELAAHLQGAAVFAEGGAAPDE